MFTPIVTTQRKPVYGSIDLLEYLYFMIVYLKFYFKSFMSILIPLKGELCSFTEFKDRRPAERSPGERKRRIPLGDGSLWLPHRR